MAVVNEEPDEQIDSSEEMDDHQEAQLPSSADPLRSSEVKELEQRRMESESSHEEVQAFQEYEEANAGEEESSEDHHQEPADVQESG